MRDKQKAAIRTTLKRSLGRSPLLSIFLHPKPAPVTRVGAAEGSAPAALPVRGSCPPPQNNELPTGQEALREQ